MRRLPVYLVIDTSGSMNGEPIEAVRNGIDLFVSSLRQDPHALETAYLSVITFDDKAQQIVPLTELADFQTPSIEAGGWTALGEGLTLTANCIINEVKKNTIDSKGDWKPLIFIMSDGVPTDDWKQGFEKLKAVKPGLIIPCSVGSIEAASVLKQLAEGIVHLPTADSATITAFFKWVTQSVSMSSQKVDSNQGDAVIGDLPPPPPEINFVF